MIKYILKDYDTKKSHYVVVALHASGLAVELGIGMKDAVSEILRVLNQANAVLEVQSAQLFYRPTVASIAEKTPGLILDGKGPQAPPSPSNEAQ